MIFIAKIILLSLAIDAWLYWLHRAFHSDKFPAWFRRIHSYHHAVFRKEGFHLSWAEWGFAISGPLLFTWLLIGLWFFPVVAFWGWFEASRGHGHYWWFKLIPTAYYQRLYFCGYKYHMYHHLKDETKNLGQFLKVWDKICKTEKAY